MKTMELINETTETLIDYNQKLVSAIEKIMELLGEGKHSKALELLGPVLEGLQWVFDAVNGINNLVDNKIYDVNQLSPYLKEMLNALENEDYVLVSDLFEYEFVPVLSSLQKSLEEKNGH